MISRRLTAFNTATASSNKIHDDRTARELGFRGGLVPGVEVHGYLCWGPVRTWGERWLTGGVISSRYNAPTYDGALVTVTFDEQTGEATVASDNGVEAVAECSMPGLQPVAPAAVDFPHLALPQTRPVASEHSLSVGHHLGSVDVSFPDAKAATYLADVREELPIYTELGVAHPGWVLGLANTLLKENVVLGPWIHVGSTVHNFAMIHHGQLVSARGSVSAQYEKSGHRFVELDVAVFADNVAAARIHHVAIYEPRQLREAGRGSAAP